MNCASLLNLARYEIGQVAPDELCLAIYTILAYSGGCEVGKGYKDARDSLKQFLEACMSSRLVTRFFGGFEERCEKGRCRIVVKRLAWVEHFFIDPGLELTCSGAILVNVADFYKVGGSSSRYVDISRMLGIYLLESGGERLCLVLQNCSGGLSYVRELCYVEASDRGEVSMIAKTCLYASVCTGSSSSYVTISLPNCFEYAACANRGYKNVVEAAAASGGIVVRVSKPRRGRSGYILDSDWYVLSEWGRYIGERVGARPRWVRVGGLMVSNPIVIDVDDGRVYGDGDVISAFPPPGRLANRSPEFRKRSSEVGASTYYICFALARLGRGRPGKWLNITIDEPGKAIAKAVDCDAALADIKKYLTLLKTGALGETTVELLENTQ